jgi:hypothetical protein
MFSRLPKHKMSKHNGQLGCRQTLNFKKNLSKKKQTLEKKMFAPVVSGIHSH